MSASRKALGALLFAAVLAAAGLGWYLAAHPAERTLDFSARGGETKTAPFSDSGYAAALARYVDAKGLVYYKGLAADREGLDAYAAALGRLDPKVFKEWKEKRKIAFWLNAYNALTLEAILAHYPIKASGLSALRFPKSSIRQIPGVWNKLKFKVMGREMTLDDIEHQELRARFDEPRIHLALVCAAHGCPALRSAPYAAAKLDEQFDDQARRFLADPQKFRIDRKKGRVGISPIFKWYGKDFVKSFAAGKKFAGSPVERAVFNFMSGHLDAKDRAYLSAGKYAVEYLDYDWSLNERSAPLKPKGSAGRD